MNFIKNILCTGLIGFISITATSNVFAAAKPETKEPDITACFKKFENAIIGRLTDSILNDNFDKYFAFVRADATPLAYKAYVEAVFTLLQANKCSSENIQKLFNAILEGLRNYFLKVVLESDRPAVKQKLIDQISESKNSVSKVLEALLDAKKFIAFCKNDKITMFEFKDFFSKLPAWETVIQELFARADLRPALVKLKIDLLALLNVTRKPKKIRKQSACTRITKILKQGASYLNPGLVYAGGMIIGSAVDMPDKEIKYRSIFIASVLVQMSWEAVKATGCWDLVKRGYARMKR